MSSSDKSTPRRRQGFGPIGPPPPMPLPRVVKAYEPEPRDSGLIKPQGLGWPLLRFGNGQFLHIQPVVEPVRLVALMQTLNVGWIRLSAYGNVIEQRFSLVQAGHPAPERKSLGITDPNYWPTANDPWVQVHHLELQHLDGGTAWTFVASKWEELGALCELSGRYGRHLHAFPNQLPVVELHVVEQRPQFFIVDWVEQTTFISRGN
jgi:hypothetical protein